MPGLGNAPGVGGAGAAPSDGKLGATAGEGVGAAGIGGFVVDGDNEGTVGEVGGLIGGVLPSEAG
jgi:hypothetical protein